MQTMSLKQRAFDKMQHALSLILCSCLALSGALHQTERHTIHKAKLQSNNYIDKNKKRSKKDRKKNTSKLDEMK